MFRDCSSLHEFEVKWKSPKMRQKKSLECVYGKS
jgi:hypothetical protein